MVNFGFIFGFLLGIPVAFIDHTFHQWWLLPILGVIVGWTTNLLGMKLIFEPVGADAGSGPFKLHGLFLRRQHEVAEVYARIIADDVVTLENIGDFLLDGPARRPDRQMLEDALRPAIDRAAGPGRGAAARVAVGTPRVRHDPRVGRPARPSTRRSRRSGTPSSAARQSEKIRKLIAERTKEMPLQGLRGDAALGDQGG